MNSRPKKNYLTTAPLRDLLVRLLNTTKKLLSWVDNLCLSLNHDRLIDFLSEIMVITKPTDTVDTEEQRNKRVSLCINSDDNIHDMKLPLGRIQYILKQIETRWNLKAHAILMHNLSLLMFTVAKDSFRTSIYPPKIDLVKEFKEIGFQNDDFHAEMQLSEIVLIMKIKN